MRAKDKYQPKCYELEGFANMPSHYKDRTSQNNNNLVDMVKLGYPVIMDCTHSCQVLNEGQTKTSGRKEMASIYGQAASICGVKGFFSEIYKTPDKALCDASTSLDFIEFEQLVKKIFNG